MQNKNDIHEDQAAQLKELFNEVKKHEQEAIMEQEESPSQREPNQIDILNLPPRKEVHSKKRYKINLKINKPFRRLLIVILVLALFIMGYVYGEDIYYLIGNR